MSEKKVSTDSSKPKSSADKKEKSHSSSSKTSDKHSSGSSSKDKTSKKLPTDPSAVKVSKGHSSHSAQPTSQPSTPKLSTMFDQPPNSSQQPSQDRPRVVQRTGTGGGVPQGQPNPLSNSGGRAQPVPRPGGSNPLPTPPQGRGRGIDRNASGGAGGRPGNAVLIKKAQGQQTKSLIPDAAFMTIKMDSNAKMRMADEQLQMKNKHMQDIMQIIKLVKFSESEFWEGQSSVMPIFKHFSKELKLASDIYNPNFVKFHFPETEQFKGLEPKVYKIDRIMPIQLVVHNVLFRVGFNQDSTQFTLSTLSGLVVMMDNHSLGTYGLGSLFQDWELKIVPKPQAVVKEARFATLNKAGLNAMDDGVKFSVLIVNSFKGAPSKLQRNLVVPTLKVSAMIHSITERLNLEAAKKYDANLFELQQMNGQPLDREAQLVNYGLGEEVTKLQLKLVVVGEIFAFESDAKAATASSTSPVPSIDVQVQDQMMNDLSMNLLRIENEKLKEEVRQVHQSKAEADEFHERAKVRNQNLKDHIEAEKDKLKVELQKVTQQLHDKETAAETFKTDIEAQLEKQKRESDEQIEKLRKQMDDEAEKHRHSREEDIAHVRKLMDEQIAVLREENQAMQAQLAQQAPQSPSKSDLPSSDGQLDDVLSSMVNSDSSLSETAKISRSELNSVKMEFDLSMHSLKTEMEAMKDEFEREKQSLQEQLAEAKNETTELNKLYEEMLGELMAANDKFRQEQQITEELNGIVAALEEEKASLRNKLVEEEEKMRLVAVAMEELAKQSNGTGDDADSVKDSGSEVESDSMAVESKSDADSKDASSTGDDAQEEPIASDLTQWVWKVLDFSSEAAEPGTVEWSASKLIGPPLVKGYGDSTEAWAPFATNGGAEFVTLKFKRKVYISDIRILENWNPGAISRIEVKHGEEFETVWEETPHEKPHVLRILQARINPPLTYGANVIKIHLDTSKVYKEWNEISAVQLAGNFVDGEEDEISEEEPEVPEEPKEEMMKIGVGKPAPKFVKKSLGTPAPQKESLSSGTDLQSELLARVNNPVARVSVLDDSTLTAGIGFGDKAFASILQNTKGILRKVVVEEKPKPQEATGLLAVMQKRFAAIHGEAEDINNNWDGKGANWDDDEWGDDDDDVL